MSDLKVTGKQTFMGQEIPVVLGGFGENQRCVADITIAEIHSMEVFNIRARLTDNIKRFVEGVDILDLCTVIREANSSAEIKNIMDLLNILGYSNQQITKAEHIYILSQRGYLKLIKIMDSDLAWDIYEKLVDEYFTLREEKKQAKQKVVESDGVKAKLAEAKLNNSKARLASLYLKIGDNALTPTYQQIMYSKATEVLAGELLLPLPKMERQTFTAGEIGERLGISANKVGHLSNENGLKNDEYGQWVHDKAKNCDKQIKTFRYYENVIPVLQELLDKEAKKETERV